MLAARRSDRGPVMAAVQGGGDRTRSRRRGLRRFLRDRSGGIELVEFALIGPVFLGLLLATFETALAFWSNQLLETALTDTSRLLYTGQFQQSNSGTTDTATLLNKLRDEFCKVDGKPRSTTFTCANVKLNVTTPAQFAGSKPPSPVDNGDWRSGFGTSYANAKAGDIVVVQAAVKFPIYFGSLLNPNQGSFSDGSRLLQATTAFRTEPF